MTHPTPQELLDALDGIQWKLDDGSTTPHEQDLIRFALRFAAIALGEPSETATDLGGKAAYQRQVDIECEKYMLFGDHPTHAIIDAGYKAMIAQVAKEAQNENA